MPIGIYKRTKEHLLIMRNARLGKKSSLETRLKMSESHKGKNTWSKGRKGFKKRTLEERKKDSENKIGNKNPMYGKKLSVEHKRKMSESHKGEKCHLWKGGITEKNHKIRTSFEIKLWRKACMERDNFTCQKTGIRGGRLEVHHINNFADFPELRTSIKNGITLSKEVHKEFHKKYGNKNNSREQLLEFLSI